MDEIIAQAIERLTRETLVLKKELEKSKERRRKAEEELRSLMTEKIRVLKEDVRRWKQLALEVKICTVCGNVCV